MNIQAIYPYYLFLLCKEMDVVYFKAGNGDKRPWCEGDSMVLCVVWISIMWLSYLDILKWDFHPVNFLCFSGPPGLLPQPPREASEGLGGVATAPWSPGTNCLQGSAPRKLNKKACSASKCHCPLNRTRVILLPSSCKSVLGCAGWWGSVIGVKAITLLLKDPDTKGRLRKQEDCASPGQGDEEAIMMLFYGFLQRLAGKPEPEGGREWPHSPYSAFHLSLLGYTREKKENQRQGVRNDSAAPTALFWWNHFGHCQVGITSGHRNTRTINEQEDCIREHWRLKKINPKISLWSELLAGLNTEMCETTWTNCRIQYKAG